MSHQSRAESYGRPNSRQDIGSTNTRLGPAQARDIVQRRLAQLDRDGSLSGAAAKHLASRLQSRRYSAGEIIVRKGATAGFMAVVTRGQVATRPTGDMTSEGGVYPGGGPRRAGVVWLPPGSTFGEATLVDDRPSENTIFAATDAEIYFLMRADYVALTKSPPARRRPSLHAGQLAAILSVVGRFATVALLIVALVFVVSLLMELGRQGDITALPQALPAAARFSSEYLENLIQGDMGALTRAGRSNGKPVLDEIARTLPKSLGLLAVALVLAVAVGLALGISAARRRNSRLSGVLLFASAIGTSTPSFFAAMLLIWFGVWLFKRTGQHFFPIAGFGWDLHLLLPALVLAARPAAAITRLGYNSLVEILDADYVRTARGKGLGSNSVLFGHVLRNAGVPLLTTAIVSLSFMLAILPIVEYVFSWPGIGQALLTAIREQDVTGAIGMILPLALLFVIVNLVAEAFYRRIDPRLRNATGGAS